MKWHKCSSVSLQDQAKTKATIIINVKQFTQSLVADILVCVCVRVCGSVRACVVRACIRVPLSAGTVPQEVYAASLATGNLQETGHEVW